jgi:hypothetical protein
MGPNELRWLEAGLQALAPSGLAPAETYVAALALVGQVRTAAQFTAAVGINLATWQSTTRALLAQHGGGEFPELTRALAAGGPSSGLDWVLDGIAARAARRRRGGVPDTGPVPSDQGREGVGAPRRRLSKDGMRRR